MLIYLTYPHVIFGFVNPFRFTPRGQDGRSATITAPSGPAQQRALQNALRDSELLLGRGPILVPIVDGWWPSHVDVVRFA